MVNAITRYTNCTHFSLLSLRQQFQARPIDHPAISTGSTCLPRNCKSLVKRRFHSDRKSAKVTRRKKEVLAQYNLMDQYFPFLISTYSLSCVFTFRGSCTRLAFVYVRANLQGGEQLEKKSAEHQRGLGVSRHSGSAKPPPVNLI